MRLEGKTIAILVYNYFEEAELSEPKRELEAEGATVDIVSPHEGQLTAMQHVNRGGTYAIDVPLKEAHMGTYDALVVPGGVVNADHLRMEPEAQQWVRSFLESAKPVAAICHGPWLLVSANCVKGRRLTSYYTLQDDIRNAGGEWLDETVVVDNSLITSRSPDDLPAFNKTLVDAISVTPGE